MAHYSYSLEPKYDKAKSFYGRAKVEEVDNTINLISYDSNICTIFVNGLDDLEVEIYDVTDYYGESLTFSSTSLRHLKEFLLQNGLRADNKNQICKDYKIIEGGQVDRWRV